MKSEDLTLIDYVLLDVIHRRGRVDDLLLARQFRCSRWFLISRLEFLLRSGCIYANEDAYALTELGAEKRIPLNMYRRALLKEASAEPETFDWKVPYIPPPDWND